MSATKDTTVLIADDDLEILSIVRSVVRGKGFTVLEATDGDEAMERIIEDRPDLVILDVMMPGQSGWEVCRSIRESDTLKDTKVIMLTGIGEQMNAMTSPLYGANAHLDKPFDIDDLTATIDRVLAEQE